MAYRVEGSLDVDRSYHGMASLLQQPVYDPGQYAHIIVSGISSVALRTAPFRRSHFPSGFFAWAAASRAAHSTLLHFLVRILSPRSFQHDRTRKFFRTVFLSAVSRCWNTTATGPCSYCPGRFGGCWGPIVKYRTVWRSTIVLRLQCSLFVMEPGSVLFFNVGTWGAASGRWNEG